MKLWNANGITEQKTVQQSSLQSDVTTCLHPSNLGNMRLHPPDLCAPFFTSILLPFFLNKDAGVQWWH